MKIKIGSNTTELQLNYLVAKCLGLNVGVKTITEQQETSRFTSDEFHLVPWFPKLCVFDDDDGYKNTNHVDAKGHYGYFEYCTDWVLSGPIIEKEKINSRWTGECWNATFWDGQYDTIVFSHFGMTFLHASMLCYVGSKLGNEVEIPDALC